MKKWAMILLLSVIYAFARAENTPDSAAQGFFAALTDGEYAQAADFCVNGEAVRRWNPPLFTRLFVYDMVQDISVSDVAVTDDTAMAVLCVTAMDLANEEVAYETTVAIMDRLATETDAATDLEYARITQENYRDFTTEYTVPVWLLRHNGVWLVDDDATFALWRGEAPLRVKVASYGHITYDEATLQYEAEDGKTPPWKIWLRLESEMDEEGLGEFWLEGGACDASLERHMDFYAIGYNAVYQRWHAHNGAYHAVLRVESLPETGELHALRRFNMDALTYVEERVTIPFENVPYFSGVPENSVQFSMQYYMRIMQEAEMNRWGGKKTYTLCTIGDWLDHFEPYGVWKWEGLTQEMRDLPIVNDQYALYMLHGVMQKAEGYFGVYDVLFKSQGQGIVPYKQECNMCPVNNMRYFGAESNYWDTAQAGFQLPVLISLTAGVDPDETLRAIQLEATFSGELIDYIGDHDSSTRLGPRTSMPVDTSTMQHWTGSVLNMPLHEESYHWVYSEPEEPEEDTETIIEWAFPEEEKGRG
ncbi:MAG: hypothetical protein IKW00_02470 [Clostridia bacterium]|nr:hypothetical protein [Clostridia bacterium]